MSGCVEGSMWQSEGMLHVASPLLQTLREIFSTPRCPGRLRQMLSRPAHLDS